MGMILDELPLSDFVQRPEAHARSLRESGAPEILTLNGAAELVVQSAPAYEALMHRIDELEAALGLVDSDQEPESFADVLEAVAEMERGEGSPASESLARLRKKLGVRSTPR